MMDARIRRLNQEEANPRGRYVLYRCGHNRRAAGNHALLFAAGEANRMQVALLVSESLSCDYPYANDRLHTFLLEGVSRTAADLRKLGAGYVFELARRKGETSRAGEWETGAAAVVVDDHPLDNGNGVRLPGLRLRGGFELRRAGALHRKANVRGVRPAPQNSTAAAAIPEAGAAGDAVPAISRTGSAYPYGGDREECGRTRSVL